jgi:methionine-rich copper-binding protein CopC
MAPATVRRTVAGAVSAIALAVLAVAGPAAPAFAHNTVIAEGPAAESTVAEQPGEVWIETNDVLLDIEGGTALDVVGPDGRHYATACPTVDGAIASASAELGPAGEYTVSYRIVSADGHPITGEHTFEWAPADGEPTAQGAADAACAASGSGDAASGDGDAAGGADDADASGSAGSGDFLFLAIAAVAVIGAGLAAYALTRRRTPPGAAATEGQDAAGVVDETPPTDERDDR